MVLWNDYNRALIPDLAPHEQVDLTPIENKSIWKRKTKPLLARWTSDFDCGKESVWWYVIKDTPLDLSSLKAKRRYEIRKGLKNFEGRRIDPGEYKEELFFVQKEALQAYPEKYRPKVEKESFDREVDGWKSLMVWGVFCRESGALCGYAYIRARGRCYFLPVLKTVPRYEKLGVNAALLYQILSDLEDVLDRGIYLCDGARSIYHETAFQDYLEKYFGFRKAYCKLHVAYRPGMGWLIRVLYRFRHLFFLLDGIGFVHRINGVLKMEELVRKQK